jgi:hypothetical protein
MTDPHYLRFVRTLALLSSIGGAGCGTSTTPGDAATTPDAASSPDTGTDAAVATVDTGTDAPIATVDTGTDAPIATSDGGNDVDAFFDCATCSCGFTAEDAGLPSCDPDHAICCVAVGPLAPPDLAA